MSRFAHIAAEVDAALSSPERPNKPFCQIAKSVASRVETAAAKDRDQEWQRVNSYIADVLKDVHVLYSKLARLQGDFVDPERSTLESVSENVLDLGEELSRFMKAFHTGEADMLGQSSFGGGEGGAPEGTPPPMIPGEFDEAPMGDEEAPKENSEEDFDTEISLEEDDEFEEEEPGEAA